MRTTVLSPAAPPTEVPPHTTRWPAAVWALLAGTFLARAAGFAYPFLAYRVADLGFSSQTVGRILAVFGLGWLLGQLLAGAVSDRVGRRTTLVTSMLLATISLPLLAQAHTESSVLAASLVVGAVYDAPRPIVSAVIADLIPTDAGRAGVNMWRMWATNVGAALTGAAGGLLAGSSGIAVLFWINAGACLVFALLARLFMSPDTRARRPAEPLAGRGAWLADSRLWLLSLASVCALTCTSGMFSSLPMLMSRDGLDARAYGLTQVANSAGVIVIAPLLKPWLERRGARAEPMVGLLAGSSLILGFGMGATGLAETTLGYSVATVVAVPGELGLIVATADILNRISPPALRGLYAGIWGTTMAIAVVVAPLLTSWSLSAGGSLLVAATTMGAGLAGAVICVPLHVQTRKHLHLP